MIKTLRWSTFLTSLFVFAVAGCNPTAQPNGNQGDGTSGDASNGAAATSASAGLVNLSHLDHLGERIAPGPARRAAQRAGLERADVRIIHIYANAPTYEWVGDDDEGIACVDDAARAAVVYLRHFELTGDRSSLEKGKALVRFVMYMQNEDGLFYNFVFDNDLTINKTHQNSKADEFGWWSARAVWALGTAARVLKSEDRVFSEMAAERIKRAWPHISNLLSGFGRIGEQHGRRVAEWK